MSYLMPGPRNEGRVVNLDNPDAYAGPFDLETAFAVLDDLKGKHPDGRFQVQKRTVFVEPWERAGGER